MKKRMIVGEFDCGGVPLLRWGRKNVDRQKRTLELDHLVFVREKLCLIDAPRHIWGTSNEWDDMMFHGVEQSFYAATEGD